MKKILFAIATSLFMLGSVLAKEPYGRQKAVTYPAVFWSELGTQEFQEIQTESSQSEVISKVKELSQNSHASRIIIIRKEGLTTRELFRNARYLDFDRALIMNHSIAFTNVSTDGFDQVADLELESTLGYNITQYVIDEENEIPVLAEALPQSIWRRSPSSKLKSRYPLPSSTPSARRFSLQLKPYPPMRPFHTSWALLELAATTLKITPPPLSYHCSRPQPPSLPTMRASGTTSTPTC
jgi:hypothetical protein